MVELFVNSGDQDQMLLSVASDLSLHCLPVTLLGSPVFNGLKQLSIYSTKVMLVTIQS